MFSLEVGPAQLRDLEPWHAEHLAEMLQRPDHDLYEWLPAWQSFEDVGEAARFVQRYVDGRAEGTRRLFGLWLDGELVGGTLFPRIEGSGTGEIGVFLAAPARGRGIVTSAVTAMIQWAFTERGLRRLEWRCVPANEPSRAIPHRLGFTLEGTLREAFPIGETFHDLEVWALLRHEWGEVSAFSRSRWGGRSR